MGASHSDIDQQFFGFRIYGIVKDGPLFDKNVKELEDFIIPPTEVTLKNKSFFDYILENKDNEIELSIYSLKQRVYHSINITPTNQWGNKNEGFLGACVRYENWACAHTNVLRVMKVHSGSFAEKMGFKEHEDFIIAIRPEGKDIITLNNDDYDPLTILSDSIEENVNNNVLFYLYDIHFKPRTVSGKIVKDKDGNTLGCDVAYGKLHEFPRKRLGYVNELKDIKDERWKKEEEIEIIDENKSKIDKDKKEENDVFKALEKVEEKQAKIKQEVDLSDPINHKEENE
jgi:hypothetical protein